MKIIPPAPRLPVSTTAVHKISVTLGDIINNGKEKKGVAAVKVAQVSISMPIVNIWWALTINPIVAILTVA